MSHLEMIKIGSAGDQLPADAPEWESVLLPQHGLMFTASNVAEELDHAACESACRAAHAAGFDDWTMPSVEQLQLLIDRTRKSPAIDTSFFHDIANDWYWTSTPTAWSSAAAWGVGFYLGSVNDHRRGLEGFALAVRRAGQ